MKISRVKLTLLVVPAVLVFLWLITELFHRLWGIRGKRLNTDETLVLAGVIVSGAALSVGVPGVIVVIAQLQALLARAKLVPKFIPRAPPYTEECYTVEVWLDNLSDVTAHHFRFLCFCYTPPNPKNPCGKPYPIDVRRENLTLLPPNIIDANSCATMQHLMTEGNHPGMRLVKGWEQRASAGTYIYPGDSLHIATVLVFGDNLILDWRLDSESGSMKDTAECQQPRS
jgi:hypothetical protein